MLNKINYIILILISRLVVSLFFAERLSYFIHPRYQLFTVVMSVLAFVFGVVGLLTKPPSHNSLSHDHSPKPAGLMGNILKLVFVAIIIYLPSYNFVPLSSRIFSIRALENTNVSVNTSPDTSLFFDTSSYGFGEWVSVISSSSSVEQFDGQPVELVGFVVNESEEYFRVARFSVTCCSVDATPVGFLVEKSGWDFADDDWVKINGNLSLRNVNGKSDIVVVADNVEITEIPKSPYIY